MINSFFLGDRTTLLVQDTMDNQFSLEAPGHLSFCKDESIGIQLDTNALMTFKG